MIVVNLNGQKKEFEKPVNLKEIVDSYNLKSVVVEYNFEIVKSEKWDSIVIKNNDNIELISFVGGG